MKLKTVFIFWLLVLSLFVPQALLAASQTMVAELEIFPRDLLAEAIDLIPTVEFSEPVTKPIIINQTEINGVAVVITVSGSPATAIVVSVF